MRLQRRPSAAPRCSRGRSWEGRPYLGDRRAHSPGEFTAALLRRRRGRRAGGPEPAGGPGEDQQHDDIGHDPRTTRGLSLEFIVRPSERSAGRGFVPLVGCGFCRVPLGRAARRRARGCAAARRRRATGASATARSRSEGARRRPGTAAYSLRSPGYGRDPPPEMIRDWGTDRGRLVGAQVRGCPPRLDGPATARLICGRHP
jgi:hypothetical protein